MSIRKLPDHVIDQIAAGEVLERPANMLKELLENSIDAGATEIDIDLELGGRKLFLSDNGAGIAKQDLVLALERHATSKIDKASDLWSLHSYGFRGEALASIAAVSRLQLRSRAKDAAEGYGIDSEFGQRSELYPISMASGTSLKVEDLFANVPARLKFLKSDIAELQAVKKMVKAFALCFPQLSLRLKMAGKVLLHYPSCENAVARVAQVLERRKMYESCSESSSVKARLVYSPPNEVARNATQMWFFVQKRLVQDKSLQAAVLAGFENTLMHGEYPICALWLDCDPQEVDVNVHPTKSQVKFRDPRLVFRVVREAGLQAVSQAPWLPELMSQKSEFSQPKLSPQISAPENHSFSTPELQQTQFRQKAIGNTIAPVSAESALDVLKKYASPHRHRPDIDLESGDQLTKAANLNRGSNFGGQDRVPTGAVETKTAPASSRMASEPTAITSTSHVQQQDSENFFRAEAPWSRLQVLGQADQCYIVAQSQTALLLIDQHAAHERVMFEKILAAWRGGHLDVQSYLLPLEITFSEEQIEALEDLREDLERLKIVWERLGPDRIGILQAPSLLREKALVESLHLLLEEVEKHGGGTAVERRLKDVAASMACHSAVRAGQALSLEQMQALLEQMDEHPLSSFCPHGRPVFVEYPFKKIDRDFGRIV